MNKNKLDIKLIIEAVISAIVVVGGAWFLVMFMNGNFSGTQTEKQVKVADKQTSSFTPEQVVKKFISASGNMGDINKATFDSVDSRKNKKDMLPLRTQAVHDAQEYVASNGLYMGNYNKYDIENWVKNQVNSDFYMIKDQDIKISNASVIDNISLQEENGKTKSYQARELTASFTSHYYSVVPTAHDVSWDGTYLLRKNETTFKNVKFKLIKQAGEWRIYSMSQVQDIGYRFATWQPSVDKNKDVPMTNVKKVKKGDSLDGTLEE